MATTRFRSKGFRAVIPALFLTLVFAGFAAALVSPPVVAQGGANVAIQNFAFAQKSITVVLGVNATVTWTNQDATGHTVTADDNSFTSGTIASGSTYSHTFTTAGIYSYHCSIHTYMKGTIIVLGAPSRTTTSSSSSSSSTSSSNGIPEFPFQAVGAAVITMLIVASYLLVRGRGAAVQR